ncbi:gamma-glutamylcyclotransferase [Glaciimonas soli]|uniref:glutathione-specific gamma-glutamylcyclotransferase n=1 Tax=Glaciimonas soli TaxID=2590999 RepID=A0A843YWD4_9BURK|nr:gamma-glutamylcyclotransferase [Glaciimonas soli]MQR01984.1 gamma-glutamylcyclotransferase [Glaciimonas soli]
MNRPPSRITREDLEQNRIRTMLDNTPGAPALLSEDALEASWRNALTSLPAPHEDIWLFGYGSLIWNPMVEHTERCPARLHGYHRGFYLYSRINRGTHDNPGLVLGLDRGGSCCGIAFRIPAASLETELPMLWRREMLTGAYLPRWLPLRLFEQNGRHAIKVKALTFVMNRQHPGYCGRLPDSTVVAHLRDASGLYGSSRDYLWHTLEGLRKEGFDDVYLSRLWQQLELDRS